MADRDSHESPGETPEQLAEATAAHLAEAAAHAASRVYNDKEFGNLAGLATLSPVEQDRILNELVVSWLVMVILLLEAPDLRMPDEFRAYVRSLAPRISKAHVRFLRGLGVEKRHCRDWQKLISLRYNEYLRDKHHVRAAGMELTAGEPDADGDELTKLQMLLPVHTVAIGCHHHVCRGQTDGRDELFRHILRAMSRFYVELRVSLEGGKITPLTRARIAVRKFFRGSD